MLELADFVHLDELDRWIAQLVSDISGLTVVAGLDPRPHMAHATGEQLLPSGRATLFRILVRQLLNAHPDHTAIIVGESRDAIRLPRDLKKRVRRVQLLSSEDYPTQIAAASQQKPSLLVVEHLCPQSTPAALAAAQDGIPVLSQLDTILCGAELAYSLLDLGARPDQLDLLHWVVALRRLPLLCPVCRQAVPPTASQATELERRFPGRAQDHALYCRAAGCSSCHHTGQQETIALFDLFCSDPQSGASSTLPMAEYALKLAQLGHLSLDVVLQLDTNQLRHTFNLLTASERTLVNANETLTRKLAELEAANRVLKQKTEALISLQDIGETLIRSLRPRELAERICHYVSDLCGAERVVLYFLPPDHPATVLAARGWRAEQIPTQVPAAQIRSHSSHPVPFRDWPPGVSPHQPDITGAALRAGLWVPLVTQQRQVGLMVVHTTRKAHFEPGQIALLQTFASQAAVAIQRAELVETLEEKIIQLEDAHAELIIKERLERELELARQVQQSVLPKVFPAIPGLGFGASNEPARQVGGDFYDVFMLGDERVALVIGDVSDKGMPAALYMALTRSLLLAEARRAHEIGQQTLPSPSAILTNVHHLLLELGQPEMFVTVFLAVIDRRTRHMSYARAGHDRPFLVRDGTITSLAGNGTFIGFPDLENIFLSDEQLELLAGDRLVLFTDGLTDAINPAQEPFGRRNLITLVKELGPIEPADLCRQIFARLKAYQDSMVQFDDMALLIVAVE